MKTVLLLIGVSFLIGCAGSSSDTPLRATTKSVPSSVGLATRNADGSILLTNFPGAFNICKKQGGRLPTIRELAEYAVNHGAFMRETQFPGIKSNTDAVQAEIRQQTSEFYMPVFAYATQSIDFYYKVTSDYRMPDDEMDNSLLFYWSSSTYAFDNNFQYTLSRSSGHIKQYNSASTNPFAVRCFQ